MVMTAATPMMMPSVVSTERRTFARMAARATRMISLKRNMVAFP